MAIMAIISVEYGVITGFYRSAKLGIISITGSVILDSLR